MSQHQQAFLANDSNEATHVERLVLSVLSGSNASAVDTPSEIDLTAFEDRLYETSIADAPQPFKQTLNDFHLSSHDIETLAQTLIPNVARRLGAAWVADDMSFADVTIGCARLQSALRDLPQSLPLATMLPQRSCLVIVPKGVQHTMGSFVLTRQLRNEGLDVMLKLDADQNTLSELVQNHSFDFVLLSASGGDCPHTIRQLIELSRAYWPDCKTIVGGTICDADTNLMKTIGADLATKDLQKVIDLCN